MTRERWYPRAIRAYPGPARKVRGVSAVRGFVGHSAEGWFGGLIYELGRSDREAAWHFSILMDGRVLQHYAVDAMVWHGGSTRAHNMVGVEHEGVAGEPLTPAQRDASVALARWLAEEWGWGQLRRRVNLWEHNEVSDRKTDCPSGRIPWAAYVDAEEGYVDRDYTVIRPSEWLSRVSERVGVPVAELVRLNGIADPNKVEAWQVLRLHDGVPRPAAAANIDTAAIRSGIAGAETSIARIKAALP